MTSGGRTYAAALLRPPAEAARPPSPPAKSAPAARPRTLALAVDVTWPKDEIVTFIMGRDRLDVPAPVRGTCEPSPLAVAALRVAKDVQLSVDDRERDIAFQVLRFMLHAHEAAGTVVAQEAACGDFDAFPQDVGAEDDDEGVEVDGEAGMRFRPVAYYAGHRVVHCAFDASLTDYGFCGSDRVLSYKLRDGETGRVLAGEHVAYNRTSKALMRAVALPDRELARVASAHVSCAHAVRLHLAELMSALWL
jgi:hypothetical protein